MKNNQQQQKKQGRPDVTKSKAELDYIRKEIKELTATGQFNQHEIAAAIQVNQSNLSKFLAGQTRLSDASVESLYASGMIVKPDTESLRGARPLDRYDGAVIKVSQAAEEKGYSAATIRKYCREGKLNYLRPKSHLLVAVDEKYAALKETEVARLRKENAAQALLVEQLQQQINKMQLEFPFVAAEEAREAEEELDGANKDIIALMEKCARLEKENNELRQQAKQQQSKIPAIYPSIVATQVAGGAI